MWLSPFYPSALADGGYDVDDYRDVDPRIGTLEQFDELRRRALHRAGIRLIVDIVPNHTSDRHVWFQEALASPPGSRARERYIFRRGRGEHGELPPSDWTSTFGGPGLGAGRRRRVVPAPLRPRAARPQLGRRRGAPGVPHHADVLGRPRRGRVPHRRRARAGQGPHRAVRQPGGPPGRHLGRRLTRCEDRDEVHDIYREWRRLFNEYDPPRTAVAEAWVPAHRRSRYASPEGLGQAFNFDLLEAGWDATTFATIIDTNLELAAESGHVVHVGALQPRRGAARHPVRAARRHRPRRVARRRRRGPAPRRGARSPPGAGSDPAHPGPARLRVPLPGRGARAARGGRPARRRPAGPDVPAVRRRAQGPRRLPGAAAVDDAGPDARLRRPGRAPAGPRRLRPVRGASARRPTRRRPWASTDRPSPRGADCRPERPWNGSRPRSRRSSPSGGQAAGRPSRTSEARRRRCRRAR